MQEGYYSTVRVRDIKPELLTTKISAVQPMNLRAVSDPVFTLDFEYGGNNVRSISNFKVTVLKQTLLSTLMENLSKHKAEYEEAERGYRNLCVKELRRRASAIKCGKAKNMTGWMQFNLRPPQNHADVYEQLIAMLEVAQEDEFEIDSTQFRMWMQDEWEWKQDFGVTHALYASHS